MNKSHPFLTKKKYRFARYENNGSETIVKSTDSPYSCTDFFFEFCTDDFILDFDNPDFLVFEADIIGDSYTAPPRFDHILPSILDRYPGVPIIADFSSTPWNRFDCIHSFEPPTYFQARDVIYLHHSYLKTRPDLADNHYFIFYDVRFEQFRYYSLSNYNGPCSFEYPPYIYRKPKIGPPFSHRQYIFLSLNKLKPQDHQLGARARLKEFCDNNSDISLFSDKKHTISNDLNLSEYNFFESQKNSTWLKGVLEDPTITQFQKYLPLTDSVMNSIDGRVEETLNRQKYTAANHVHSSYYEESYCSIYAETVEDNYPTVSEKTWHALSKGHFIVPFGSAGLIKLIQSFGFRLPSFINYNYDNIKDDNLRLEAYFIELNRLKEFPIHIWNDYLQQNYELILHNIKLFHIFPNQNPIRDYFDIKSNRKI